MLGEALGQIILLFILFTLGTFFSSAEMAFSALSRPRIKHLASSGSKRAQLVLRLCDNFDELISTLLICNNAVAVAAATVGAIFFMNIIQNESIAPVISSVTITLIVVIFTDDLPKSIAKRYPEPIAVFIAPIIQITVFIFKPINFFIVRWKRFIGRKFSPKDTGRSGQELLYVVEEAEQDGTINEEDSTLISNAIEFNDLKAGDIITHRVDIVAITKDSTLEDIQSRFIEHGYSRLPVYETSLDNIIGCIHIRDFLKYHTDKTITLESIMTPAIHTATSTRVTELLKRLNREKSHIAVVIDEYGGTEGIVTMEDILRQLVGDIWDETDEVVELFVSLGDNKYKILCDAEIDRMFEYFDMESKAEANTVGGWVMDILERIPVVGDNFQYKNLNVTITKADIRHAEEIIVEVTQPIKEEL